MNGLRADLYSLLAETLAGTPTWFHLPAQEWPLFEVTKCLAERSPAAAKAVGQLGRIPAEDLRQRQAHYSDLFMGQGEPRFWLYESAQREGSLLGPTTTVVGRLYRAAGLEIVGAELPDHASLELSFLSYLALQQDIEASDVTTWRQLERLFIKRHAGCWLPQLGQALAASGDVVYGPIGALLADWLSEMIRPVRTSKRTSSNKHLPIMQQPDACTLCGFCVQICPTQALAVSETDRETRLLFQPARCTACRRCTDICTPKVLIMAGGEVMPTSSKGPQVMVRSDRVVCRGCGNPMISRAELDFVQTQLGDLDWLAYCLSCRQKLL